MRNAIRPLAAVHVDAAAALAQQCEAASVIEAQAAQLLAQDLTGAQRSAVLAIARHARELINALGGSSGVGEAEVTRPQSIVGPLTSRDSQRPARNSDAPSTRDLNVPHVLIVDDDEEMLELLTEILASRYVLTLARDGAEALAAMAAQTFSLAIVDLNLPTLDGFGVAEEMASLQRPIPPFMFLSAQASSQAKVRGLALGAADYVTKPFDPDELVARIARILAAVTREASLRADAMTDSLTGLSNYRSFMESLLREVERSRRYAQPLALLTVDLDHLKAINDEHGHDAGNEAIVRLAEVLKGAVRRLDVVARHGGDEFAVLLPNTDAAEAMMLAERLGEKLGERPLRGMHLTASIGVAYRDEVSDLDAAALVKVSDEALYRAKRAGRARAELARPHEAARQSSGAGLGSAAFGNR